MREVSKEEFFQTLYSDHRDIMPRIVGAWDPVACDYESEWSQVHTRVLFGRSKGGKYWLVSGEES